MRWHNLRTVIGFEVIRTLRRPVFWAITLGVPVLFAGLIGLSTFSSLAAPSSIEEQTEATRSFSYTDDSGLIDAGLAAERGGRVVDDPQAGREAVRSGEETLYIHYPKDPTRTPTEVFGADRGIINNTAYNDVARQLLTASAQRQIGSEQLSTLAGGGAPMTTTTYANGEESGSIRDFLPPLMFLVLFFMAVTMLGNQMLNITVEEKENRVTEMILTTVGSTTLITGKMIAVCIIGLVQSAVFTVPGLTVGIIGIVALPARVAPVFDPSRMTIGFLLFLGGFLMFTGLLICVGSLMPSAKEAGGAFAAVVIALFLPLYAVTLVLSYPHGPVSQVLTYFPLTAPITAMLRNASGALSGVEAAIVLAILFGFAVGFLYLGSKLFATGSLSYDQRLNPLRLLRRARHGDSPAIAD